MNFHVFAESLTLDEIDKLHNILWNMKKRYARQNMSPVSDNERMLVKNGEYIQAVKEYRARLRCSLFEAKVAIDSVKRENE